MTTKSFDPKSANTTLQIPSSLGACLIRNEADEETLRLWLKKNNKQASIFACSEIESLIQQVKDEAIRWIVVTSAGWIMQHPEFSRLFKASIDFDADLITANDDFCLSIGLNDFVFENWGYYQPGMVQYLEEISADEIKDAMKCVMRYLRQQARMNDSIKSSEAKLTPTEKDLLNASSFETPLNGPRLAEKAGHEINGHIKGCLSNLVKHGLLTNTESGYLRT